MTDTTQATTQATMNPNDTKDSANQTGTAKTKFSSYSTPAQDCASVGERKAAEPEGRGTYLSNALHEGDDNSDGSGSVIELLEDEEEGIELLNRDDNDKQLMSLLEVVQHRKHNAPGYSPRKGGCSYRRVASITLIVSVMVALSYGAFLLYERRLPSYSCPTMETDEERSKLYLLSENNVENDTAFMLTYREKGHDHWGWSFEEYKDEMYSWKASRFAELKDGDTIYESASGLGLNLVMTLEILHEMKNVSNLVVYGNEYVAESVKTSNRLMEEGILPAGGRKGRICQGDSGNISWVPSNSFDLVYTGYITPLQDPLEFHLGENALWNKYDNICGGVHSVQTARVEQMRMLQEDWYSQWVSEMIRIAKPGVPVIVEQVSPSVCTFWDDWGGVDKGFWYNAPVTYGWDVDPASIEMENDESGNQDGRYHVFMRKNK